MTEKNGLTPLEPTPENTINISAEQGNVAATELLERTPPPAYVQEWTSVLANERTLQHEEIKKEEEQQSLFIFRLRKEWLALPILAISQICEKRKVHHIPKVSNAILTGLVNIRGQMRLCVALHNLLEIPGGGQDEAAMMEQQQLLVIEKEGEVWVFPIDEIYGIYQCDLSKLENAPVTVTKSNINFLRGVFKYNAMTIGLLDDELLFYSLKRNVA